MTTVEDEDVRRVQASDIEHIKFRLTKRLWLARVRCWCYTMFRFQCEYIALDGKNKILMVAAVKPFNLLELNDNPRAWLKHTTAIFYADGKILDDRGLMK